MIFHGTLPYLVHFTHVGKNSRSRVVIWRRRRRPFLPMQPEGNRDQKCARPRARAGEACCSDITPGEPHAKLTGSRRRPTSRALGTASQEEPGHQCMQNVQQRNGSEATATAAAASTSRSNTQRDEGNTVTRRAAKLNCPPNDELESTLNSPVNSLQTTTSAPSPRARDKLGARRCWLVAAPHPALPGQRH
jgi:hypothetical protein